MSPRNAELEGKYVKRMTRLGEFLTTLGDAFEPEGLAGGWLREIRILCPTESRTDVLIVVKASRDDGDWVAFVGGLTADVAVAAWMAREANEGLKWRVDKPWGERNGGVG